MSNAHMERAQHSSDTILRHNTRAFEETRTIALARHIREFEQST